MFEKTGSKEEERLQCQNLKGFI